MIGGWGEGLPEGVGVVMRIGWLSVHKKPSLSVALRTTFKDPAPEKL
jgi:hypothetical protein